MEKKKERKRERKRERKKEKEKERKERRKKCGYRLLAMNTFECSPSQRKGKYLEIYPPFTFECFNPCPLLTVASKGGLGTNAYLRRAHNTSMINFPSIV